MMKRKPASSSMRIGTMPSLRQQPQVEERLFGDEFAHDEGEREQARRIEEAR